MNFNLFDPRAFLATRGDHFEFINLPAAVHWATVCWLSTHGRWLSFTTFVFCVRWLDRGSAPSPPDHCLNRLSSKRNRNELRRFDFPTATLLGC